MTDKIPESNEEWTQMYCDMASSWIKSAKFDLKRVRKHRHARDDATFKHIRKNLERAMIRVLWMERYARGEHPVKAGDPS